MAQAQTRQRSGGQSRNGSRPRSRSPVERVSARVSEAADGLGPIAQKSAKPAMAAGAALAGLATGGPGLARPGQAG